MAPSRAAAAALALAALLPLPCLAQADYLRTRTRVDWEGRVIELRVELDMAGAGIRLPAGRLEAERLVERELAGIAKDAVFSLTVDSHRDVAATVADGEIEVDGLLGAARDARRTSASFTRDLRAFVATYSIPLGDVAALYGRGREAVPLEPPLGYNPSRPYTGIVIYAEGELPVRGERVSGSIRPCLFPRIYDEDMRTVLARANVDPEILTREGPVGYARELTLDEVEDRVGGDPLRVMATALFGDNRTDLIISREDASRILARPENRDLVRRGRVLVVIGRP